MKRIALASLLIAISAVGVSLVARQGTAAAPADLVLRNGRVLTVDDAKPEGQAIAVTAGKVTFVGTNAEIARYVGPKTQVIDLAGQLAIPGFIEGHGHFPGVGEGKMNLELMDTKSWEEIVAMVDAAVKKAKPGQWIVGRGWHQDKWNPVPQPNVEGFPLQASLDKVSPNNPVILTHASGHGAYANAKAMEVSNITKITANPTGGEILRDKNGNAVGFLRESAAGLVRRPPLTEDERRESLRLADLDSINKGITSFQDAGTGFEMIDLMKKMIDEGKMNIRLYVMVRANNAALRQNMTKYRVEGYGNGMLSVRSIKVSADGALGSRGAWLLEPYADKPDSTGLVPAAVATLPETTQIALDSNVQLNVHAIGDRANREVLNIYEAAFKKNAKNGKDLRWRIEHAQHLSAADIPRFGQMGVIASMQANHCTSDSVFVPARLGDKRSAEGAYVWQKLMKSGAIVTQGTDAPVENSDPIPNYYSAVTRKNGQGNVFYADQRLSRMEALKSYTIHNAYAAFEEKVKGSLTPGKYADITVLSKDITKVPDEEIKTAKVSYTIVGGKVVYKR
jgi:predicted amidohydrolase YtcJ